VLCPEADQITPPSVTTCREDDVEIASIGGSNIRVYEDGDVLAKIETSGARYEITGSGIQRV
jgi:hypothetical protein